MGSSEVLHEHDGIVDIASHYSVDETVERLKDSDMARFTFRLDSADLQWGLDPEQKAKQANVAVAGTALGSVFDSSALATRVGTWRLSVPEDQGDEKVRAEVSVMLPVAPNAKRLRFVFEDLSNGRMGTVDVPMDAMAKARTVDEPARGLVQRLPLSTP